MCDADDRMETKRRVERTTGVQPRPEARVIREGYEILEVTELPPVPEPPAPPDPQVPPQNGGAPRL